jgi:hypothetical protein
VANRITETITITSIDQIPLIETIQKTPREKILSLHFEGAIEQERDYIGNKLKNNLIGFQVRLPHFEPEINICKLITDEEIELNQSFFEHCAKDYRALSERLIVKLAHKLKVKIDPDFPLLSFNPLKTSKKQIGEVEEWKYFLHGYHCGFRNKKSGQLIEVPLVFGLEFGDLDPYFFTKFIKSTKEYHPLPVFIYEDYEDGIQINRKMLSLGIFEKINSNIENHFGIVVKDRKKINVDVYKEKSNPVKKTRFNLFRFFGLY